KSDEAAWQIVAAGVSALVDFTTAAALRLHLDAPEVRLMGGLFEHQKFYGVAFAAALKEKIPAAQVGPSESSPEVGAAWLAANAIEGGGRMFYVGAGTSGRLGVLDAAEIPPTFGASDDLFQGIIAGGAPALRRSIEGAEDDARAGALAMDERAVRREDVVIGISASGQAAFVTEALRRAHEIGAQTILLTSNATV